MYAMIETGGKQYKVSKGDTLAVEKLDAEEGAELVFDRVLLVSTGEDAVTVGSPYVAGAKVTAKIVAQTKGEKVIVFKFKKRKNYRRKRGHRQLLTKVEILDITT